MRSFSRVIMAIIICLLLSSYTGCVIRYVRGSGNITQKSYPAATFSSIQVCRGIEATLSSQAKEISVYADDNIIDKIIISVEDDMLTVTLDEAIHKYSDITAMVTIPIANIKINTICVSSGAEIKSDEVIMTDSLSILSSSAGEISLAATSRSCTIGSSSGSEVDLILSSNSYCMANASSGAEINLKGTGSQLDASASSGAEIDAFKFSTDYCSATASSGAEINVQCNTKLNATAASGADIFIKGEAKDINATQSSGGKVKKIKQ